MDFGYFGFQWDFEFSRAVFGVGRGPVGFIMVLRFILTDSQPGKCIFDPFPTRFQDFGTFPRRLHGLEARYLSGLRPGRPNSDKSGFPGRTEKLRAEKSCRLMVVSHRVLHFSSLLCPFKIVDFQLILLISGAFHLRIRPSECTLNLSVNRRGSSDRSLGVAPWGPFRR